MDSIASRTRKPKYDDLTLRYGRREDAAPATPAPSTEARLAALDAQVAELREAVEQQAIRLARLGTWR